MTYPRLRRVLAAAALVASLSLGGTAVGDGVATASRSRLPATVAEVNRFIESSQGLRTLDEVRAMSGTHPDRIAPQVYRWRLADGRLDTATSRTEKGEFITCWGRVR
jgi:hypothetical protein